MKDGKFGKRLKTAQRMTPPKPRTSLVPWRAVILLMFTAVLIIGAATAGTWALMEFVVWNRLPSELVGKWAVVQGPPEYTEAVFEFHRSGKLIARVNDRGNVGIINAEIRVEGDKIYSTTKSKQTGIEHVSVQTIRSLTRYELVVVDDKGREMKMARVN